MGALELLKIWELEVYMKDYKTQTFKLSNLVSSSSQLANKVVSIYGKHIVASMSFLPQVRGAIHVHYLTKLEQIHVL